MDNDKKEALIRSTQGVLLKSMEKPRNGELSDGELDNVSGGVTINEREFTAVIYGTDCFNGQFLNNPLHNGKFARDDNHSQRERFRSNAHKPEGFACCAYCLRLAFSGGMAYCELSGR